MTPLGFFTGTESPQQVLAVLAGALGIFGLVIFYITMIKPKQDEKRESKRQGESSQDPVDDIPNYDEIIDNYPTLFTQDGVKK